jgi:hypothetical protein
MTASKVGNHIYVTGTGNTLATIVADIADAAWIASIGGGVYELYANHELHIRPGAEFTIGNSGDYSIYERLDYKGTSNNSLRFWVWGSATLYMYGDAHMDFAAGSPNWYYASPVIYGSLEIHGDATYRPSWGGIWTASIAWSTTSKTDRDAWVCDVEYMDFNNRVASRGGGFGLSFTLAANPAIRWYRCTFDGNAEWAAAGQGRGRPPYVAALSSATEWLLCFEECVVQHFDNALYTSSGGLPYFKNCTFRDCDTSGTVVRSPFTKLATWRHPGLWSDVQQHTEWAQDFTFIEGTSWSGINSSIDLVVNQGSIVLLKDCTFEDLVQYQENGTILFWTGNTLSGGFTGNVTAFAADVYALKITVTDEQAVPLEGASVIVRQKDGKEEWRFTTDVLGEINCHPLMNSQCICINRWWDDIPDTWEYLSDDSNSTYHEIIVSAPGYVTRVLQQVMDQDRVLPVVLTATGAGSIGDTLDSIQARVRRLQDR